MWKNIIRKIVENQRLYQSVDYFFAAAIGRNTSWLCLCTQASKAYRRRRDVTWRKRHCYYPVHRVYTSLFVRLHAHYFTARAPYSPLNVFLNASHGPQSSSIFLWTWRMCYNENLRLLTVPGLESQYRMELLPWRYEFRLPWQIRTSNLTLINNHVTWNFRNARFADCRFALDIHKEKSEKNAFSNRIVL